MLGLALALSACTSASVAPASIIGQTFAEADAVLPDDAVYLVQDVSVSFGLEPSYVDSEFGSSRWTVISACSSADTLESSSTIEIAVAPSEVLTEDERQAARKGEYAQAVTCDF